MSNVGVMMGVTTLARPGELGATMHLPACVQSEFRVSKKKAAEGCKTVCISLRVVRPVAVQGLRWKVGRGRRMESVEIATRSLGDGKGPSRAGFTTPRRLVKEEASTGDGTLANEDSQDDVNTRNAEIFSGRVDSSNPQTPATNAEQLLQDQFNRFAAAVALADRKMAEEIIREMGDGEAFNVGPHDFSDEENFDSAEELEVSASLLDESFYQAANSLPEIQNVPEDTGHAFRGPFQPFETSDDVEDITDVERQLEELYQEVEQMIEEGDEDVARELIQANYEALVEQLDEGVRGVEQAAMLDILAQLYMNMGDFDSAAVLLRETKSLLEHITRDQPLLDRVLDHVASMYVGIREPEEAIPLYTRSLDLQRRFYGKNNPLIAKTMLGLAKAFSDNDEASKSIELYQQVLILMVRSKGQDDESVVIPLTHLGHVYLEEERTEEAEKVLQRAVGVTKMAYGELDGRVGVATCALARVKVAQGDADEAVRLFRKGLSLMDGCSRFSSDDPVVEVVRTDLAEMLSYLERDAEAQELWEENLRVREQVFGTNDVQLVPHLNNVATAYAHSQNFDKCEPILRRMLKLMSIHFGPRAPQISVPLEMLATALHHLGRGFEAESLARDAVSIRESHYGKDHPTTGQAYNCLAAVLHGLEKVDESEALLWKVLKIQERELGPSRPELILTLELLVMLFNEQGRTDEAQPLIRRMQKIEASLNPSEDE